MCKDLSDMRVKIAHMEDYMKETRGDMHSLVQNTNMSLTAINKKIDDLAESIGWFIDAIKAAKWLTKTLKWLAAIGLAWVVVNEWAVSAWDWLTHWKVH